MFVDDEMAVDLDEDIAVDQAKATTTPQKEGREFPRLGRTLAEVSAFQARCQAHAERFVPGIDEAHAESIWS